MVVAGPGIGEPERAERLRQASLEQITSEDFGEYFEPFTGKLLGSDNQSWTAAVVSYWLAGPRLGAIGAI